MSSYFNNSIPLFVSQASINNIQNEIDQLQTDVAAIESNVTILAGDVGTLQTQVSDNTDDINDINISLLPQMVQFYKLLLPTIETPLVGNVYTIVEGYTNLSLDLSGAFTNPSPGVLQYNGPSTFFFQINYQITSSIDSGVFNCIFLLHRNITELTSSRQTVSMSNVGTHNLVAANGSVLTPISPGDTITLRAQLLDSADPNVLNVFDLSMSIFKIPTI